MSTQTEQTTTATEQAVTCGWKCGDPTPEHKHFAVLVRENGVLLGRLTPDGTATNRRIFACLFSQARAAKVAQEINDDTSNAFAAKVIPF